MQIKWLIRLNNRHWLAGKFRVGESDPPLHPFIWLISSTIIFNYAIGAMYWGEFTLKMWTLVYIAFVAFLFNLMWTFILTKVIVKSLQMKRDQWVLSRHFGLLLLIITYTHINWCLWNPTRLAAWLWLLWHTWADLLALDSERGPRPGRHTSSCCFLIFHPDWPLCWRLYYFCLYCCFRLSYIPSPTQQ